ncbi:MAG: aromatic amino acid hydroxylase [Myxococcales bacterium]|nr:MAG: aromatic amino acid hydroxylase [Myxococcales bacterium]
MRKAMSETHTLDRVPFHLRPFVVEQDYSAYNEMDQAVWRFVLLHTGAHLKDTAHPAYRRGLSDTGISVERIPRIAYMDTCLSHFGWGAVCVDGFIPPRAFQEFLRLAILPIAADIRSRDQLPYTPAPDIIHESAGHSPILVDPGYAAFLKKSGEVGSKAFSCPYDARLYNAIFDLSETKGNPNATAAEIARAEANLSARVEEKHDLSEAARLARFYWWTVEYGLVGTLDDYQIYGAGLLSSLGESHISHIHQVEKRKLSLECLETGYDITRTQPQLFVAESFEQLNEVLEQAAETMAYRQGGLKALSIALSSQEVATTVLNSGMQIIAELSHATVEQDTVHLIAYKGPVALAENDRIVVSAADANCLAQEYLLPLGRLADGEEPSDQSESEFRKRYLTSDAKLHLKYRSGMQVKGQT